MMRKPVSLLVTIALAALVAACTARASGTVQPVNGGGGGAASPTPAAASPTPTMAPTAMPTAEATATPAPSTGY
jgi:hypothetical protein